MSDDKYEGLGLSEEEISAMEAELGEDEGVGVKADEEDNSAEAEVSEPEADEESAEEAQDGAEGEPEAEAEPEAEEAAATPEKAAETAEPAPQAVAEPEPSKLDKLNADLAKLKEQFDEGDLSIDEYIDAKSALDRQIVKAELKAELAQESANKSWEQSQKDFLGQNTYLRDNDVLYDAFAMQVNKLLADPKNASMSDADLLAAARAKVDAAIGRKPDAEPSKKDESLVKSAKKSAADRSKAPTTLQGIPSAAQADDVEGNKFAYLDRLTGAEFEAAIAKLSPDDMNRWARSQ